MTSHVHEFEAREGGAFRVSLTYDEPVGAGKTTAHTNTYRGHFVKLAPDEQVVEVMEFETTDPGPEAYLRDDVRSGMSSFTRVPASAERLRQLRRDIESGLWRRTHGNLLARDFQDLGYRLVTTRHGRAMYTRCRPKCERSRRSPRREGRVARRWGPGTRTTAAKAAMRELTRTLRIDGREGS